MVLSGQKIIDNCYVQIPADGMSFDVGKQIQPNGVDLRLTEVFDVHGTASLGRDIPMDFSMLRADKVELRDGWFALKRNRNYVVNFREKITVPPHYCAIIKGRSSMLRVGALVDSALWDAGFSGTLGAVIRTLNPLDIEFGARLAQVLFLNAEEGSLYSGRYQGTTSQTALMSDV